jgi:hypothetical protein
MNPCFGLFLGGGIGYAFAGVTEETRQSRSALRKLDRWPGFVGKSWSRDGFRRALPAVKQAFQA